MAQDALKVFDVEHGLKIFEDSREMLMTIVEAFLAETPKEINRLEEAIAQSDIEGSERYSHRMAGSATMIGAMRFSAKARALELVAKGGSLIGVPDMFKEIQAEFAAFKKEAEAEAQAAT